MHCHTLYEYIGTTGIYEYMLYYMYLNFIVLVQLIIISIYIYIYIYTSIWVVQLVYSYKRLKEQVYWLCCVLNLKYILV